MKPFACQVISEASFRLPEGHALELKLKQFSTAGRGVDVRIETPYRDAGFTSHLPVYLTFDCTLEASDLNEAVQVATLTAAVLIPAIAVAANASYLDPSILVAYDADPATTRHPLLFNHLFLNENSVLAGSREIAPSLILPIVERLVAHHDAERLHRSMVHYNEALLVWRPGTELRAVESLFLVAETVAPVALASYQAMNRLSDQELALTWKDVIAGPRCPKCNHAWIRRGDLVAGARRKLVFDDKTEVYRRAKRVSDGLEHGFQNLPALQEDARTCRDEAAALVRKCLLGLLFTPEEPPTPILAAPFDKPLRRDPVDRQLTMNLNGAAGALAPVGHRHPVIRVQQTIKDLVLRPDGSAEITTEGTYNFSFADGVVADNLVTGFGSRATTFNIKDVVVRRGTESKGAV